MISAIRGSELTAKPSQQLSRPLQGKPVPQLKENNWEEKRVLKDGHQGQVPVVEILYLFSFYMYCISYFFCSPQTMSGYLTGMSCACCEEWGPPLVKRSGCLSCLLGSVVHRWKESRGAWLQALLHDSRTWRGSTAFPGQHKKDSASPPPNSI